MGEVRRVRYAGSFSNHAPRASIDSPADQTSFAAGGTIPLIGSGSDHEDPSSALAFQWWVDGVPDNVIQPDARSFGGPVSWFVADALPPGTEHRYEVHLVVWDTDGKSDTTRVEVMVDAPLAAPALRPSASLSAPLPNPSGGGVTVSVELPVAGRVAWTVHDLLGRVAWSEPARIYESGRWQLVWDGRRADGRRLRPGLYFARIRVDGRTFVRRLALVR